MLIFNEIKPFSEQLGFLCKSVLFQSWPSFWRVRNSKQFSYQERGNDLITTP